LHEDNACRAGRARSRCEWHRSPTYRNTDDPRRAASTQLSHETSTASLMPRSSMNLDINGSARRLLTTVYCRPRDIACNQPGKYPAQIVPGSPALPPTCATLQSCARLKTRKFDVSCFPSPWYGIPALTRLAACQSSQRRKASESLFGPTDAFDRSCVILDVTTFIERQCVSKVERDRSTSTRWYLVHACASSRRIDPHTSRQPVLSGPHCATLARPSR
jgi:hypothetical protein